MPDPSRPSSIVISSSRSPPMHKLPRATNELIRRVGGLMSDGFDFADLFGQRHPMSTASCAVTARRPSVVRRRQFKRTVQPQDRMALGLTMPGLLWR